jgi:hypothetical protein
MKPSPREHCRKRRDVQKLLDQVQPVARSATVSIAGGGSRGIDYIVHC